MSCNAELLKAAYPREPGSAALCPSPSFRYVSHTLTGLGWKTFKMLRQNGLAFGVPRVQSTRGGPGLLADHELSPTAVLKNGSPPPLLRPFRAELSVVVAHSHNPVNDERPNGSLLIPQRSQGVPVERRPRVLRISRGFRVCAIAVYRTHPERCRH